MLGPVYVSAHFRSVCHSKLFFRDEVGATREIHRKRQIDRYRYNRCVYIYVYIYIYIYIYIERER